MVYNKKERRRGKRYNVDGIHGNLLYASDVNIVDVSLDSAAIETSIRLNIDKEYWLKVRFRDTLLVLKGIILWSMLNRTETKKSGETIPVYRSEIQFTNLLKEKTDELMMFIEENRIESVENMSIPVRSMNEGTDNAQIDYPYKYHISRISLSGMMIESDAMFDIDSRHEMEVVFDSKTIIVTGRIVNCVEIIHGGKSRYNIGIEFKQMSDEDRDFLREFLDSLHDKEEE